MRDQDEFDLTLDAALSSYGDPGPASGLEQRVLARVASSRTTNGRAANARSLDEFKPSPHRRSLLWFLTVPAVACLLLFAVLLKTPRPEANQSTPSRPVEQAAITTNQVARPALAHADRADHIAPPALAARHHLLAESSSPQPKLDVFPTPRPLTLQEEALVAAVAQTPQSQREALLEADKHKDAPISIAAINIPPLESPEDGKN